MCKQAISIGREYYDCLNRWMKSSAREA